MTTHEQLRQDLDEGVFVTLRAMADDAEERGDPFMASGYRWLAETRREPWWDHKQDCYYWQKDWKPDRFLGATVYRSPRNRLPTSAWESARGGYSSRGRAYVQAAFGVASWLRKEAERGGKA